MDQPPLETQPVSAFADWPNADTTVVAEPPVMVEEKPAPPPGGAATAAPPVMDHQALINQINERNKANAAEGIGNGAPAGSEPVDKPIAPGAGDAPQHDDPVLQKEKKITSDREAEIRLFVEAFHQLFFELESQIKYNVAGVGKPQDYLPDEKIVERMNFYGAKIAAKHGWDKFMTVEMGYFINFGRAELPSWRQVLLLRKEHKKVKDKDQTIEKLVLQNNELVNQMQEWIRKGGPTPAAPASRVGITSPDAPAPEANPDLIEELTDNRIGIKKVKRVPPAPAPPAEAPARKAWQRNPDPSEGGLYYPEKIIIKKGKRAGETTTIWRHKVTKLVKGGRNTKKNLQAETTGEPVKE